VEGDVEADTSGGSIEIRDVRGEVEADTSGGGIRIDGATGDISADTSGGASLWIYLAAGLNNVPTGNTGAQLIGYPANETSEMAAALTTGNTILTVGDFSRYVIVDRVGMSVELLPHLLGSNRRPTGQRGLYAFWRNGAGVVDANAFRRLVTL